MTVTPSAVVNLTIACPIAYVNLDIRERSPSDLAQIKIGHPHRVRGSVAISPTSEILRSYRNVQPLPEPSAAGILTLLLPLHAASTIGFITDGTLVPYATSSSSADFATSFTTSSASSTATNTTGPFTSPGSSSSSSADFATSFTTSSASSTATNTTSPFTSPGSSSSSNSGAIAGGTVGGTVGGIAVVGSLILAAVWILKQRQSPLAVKNNVYEIQ
ncbi:hypothetical protein V8E54_007048 [Elaphomyces granulatus]